MLHMSLLHYLLWRCTQAFMAYFSMVNLAARILPVLIHMYMLAGGRVHEARGV